MQDESSFQGFNKQGKGKPAATKSTALSPMLKQLFYRLQDGSAMQLTPQEKAALLTLYQKAFPAFFAREMAELADAKARSSWRERGRRFARGVGFIVMGILIVFIAVMVWRIFA